VLTSKRAREVLDYDPKSGVLSRNGKQAGGKGADGYRTVSVFGRRYRAARIVWLWMTGDWPKGDIDHINNDPMDDRWENLREASRVQNLANTRARSGLKGACWVSAKNKWKAQIRRDGKNRHLGYFDTPEEANAAYRDAALKAHGEFAQW
jgi:hypothetical protein